MWTTLEAGSTPVVGTFHSGAARSWLFDAAAPLLRRVAKRITTRIAVSEAAASFARKRLGGVYEIVPNAVDTARFEHAAPADLGPGTKLLFVGRLDERKGFPTAVDAFSLLADGRPGLRLIVVGDGPDRSAVGKLQVSLRDRVTLLGTIPNVDLPPYLATCDVYIGSAVGGESFGVVLVEAMAAGLPVIASGIAGYTEVVRAGVDGLLVKPRDPAALAGAVTRVLDEPGLAEQLTEAGHDRARSFDWAVAAARIEEIYRRTIQDASASIR
jgi:phosphatidylinositol alpha-mannosyltransferase